MNPKQTEKEKKKAPWMMTIQEIEKIFNSLIFSQTYKIVLKDQ